MNICRKIFILAAVTILGFVVGWTYQPKSDDKRTSIKLKFAEAFPAWNRGDNKECVPANPYERKMFQTAVSTLELVGKDWNGGWLDIGAINFLGTGMYRGEVTNATPVCVPEDIYEHLSDIITTNKNFSQGRLEKQSLELASKLPHPSPYIIDVVASSAFNEIAQIDTSHNEDIRPFARTVLAGFGKQASSYAETAYKQISGNDSLGTGAAQVAAGADYPDALPRIQTLMQDMLSSIPKDKAIPWNTRNRLYELSYAIYFAGEDAKKYTMPIKELMTRKVESWAPPFGMVELSPKRMCRVLKYIDGESAIANYAFCTDDKIPFEQ